MTSPLDRGARLGPSPGLPARVPHHDLPADLLRSEVPSRGMWVGVGYGMVRYGTVRYGASWGGGVGRQAKEKVLEYCQSIPKPFSIKFDAATSTVNTDVYVEAKPVSVKF